jgi:predicted RNA-binding Zn-ribbon protein involved in translation (DUF1610 family)
MLEALTYDTPFPFGTILVPPVRLDAGNLYFRPAGSLWIAQGLPERLAFDFAGLSSKADAAILSFAREWGVLGICRHGKPVHHQVPACLPRRVRDEFVEPVVRWRSRARYVHSMLRIKTALRRDRPGGPDDWKKIWPGPSPTGRPEAADRLSCAASIFLSQANVQPFLQCEQGRFAMTFIGGSFPNVLKSMKEFEEIRPWLSSAGTLLAQIAIRTVLALQEGAVWAICSNCRRLYRTRRQVAQGRLHFCPDCGKRASWRLSKRRKAVRQAGQLAYNCGHPETGQHEASQTSKLRGHGI